jgi:hypothetical protein
MLSLSKHRLAWPFCSAYKCHNQTILMLCETPKASRLMTFLFTLVQETHISVLAIFGRCLVIYEKGVLSC